MNKNISEIQTKFAFDSHIAQFESIRAEITSATELQNNLVNYSIAAIAGAVALFAFKNNGGIPILTQEPAILAIISVVMSMLTWASLEAEIRIHDYRSYIDKVLSKKVQNLIGGIELPDDYIVFKMEIAEISRVHRIRSIIRGLLVSGKFMISYIPAIVALIIFASSFSNWYTLILFWLAAIPALIVPLVLAAQVIFVSGYYWQKTNKPLKKNPKKQRATDY
jgi:hypothetical protein